MNLNVDPETRRQVESLRKKAAELALKLPQLLTVAGNIFTLETQLIETSPAPAASASAVAMGDVAGVPLSLAQENGDKNKKRKAVDSEEVDVLLFGAMPNRKKARKQSKSKPKSKPSPEELGYPRACEFCNDYVLQTPRSKSGHERRCPGKVLDKKEKAAASATTEVADKVAEQQKKKSEEQESGPEKEVVEPNDMPIDIEQPIEHDELSIEKANDDHALPVDSSESDQNSIFHLGRGGGKGRRFLESVKASSMSIDAKDSEDESSLQQEEEEQTEKEQQQQEEEQQNTSNGTGHSKRILAAIDALFGTPERPFAEQQAVKDKNEEQAVDDEKAEQSTQEEKEEQEMDVRGFIGPDGAIEHVQVPMAKK